MPTNTLNGRTFDVDDQGFFTHREQWSEELAHDLASLIDLDLTDRHLAAIRFLRDDHAVTGATATLHRAQEVGGFPVGELCTLFPGKTAQKLAWLSGLPKPIACV